jgi:hypothetical protein
MPDHLLVECDWSIDRGAGATVLASLYTGQWRLSKRAALLVAALLPAACAVPQPSSDPFAGAWTTAEHQQIAFRANTVVVNEPNTPPTPMSAQSCDGAFRFGYGEKSRAALIALAPRQPDLRKRLEALLVRPEYKVAELTCGEGGSTYVLLDDRDLVAIHRDRDIAGVERLTRL